MSDQPKAVPEWLEVTKHGDVTRLVPWVMYYSGSDEISLDGNFTLTQLRQLADMIDANREESDSEPN